jgi:alpha-N-acetylglucosamine transferase
MEGKNNMHFQKLGVFGLTHYKKLMWMDWDLQIKENMDELCEKDTNNGMTIYGQRDDWKCTGKKNVTQLWSSASGGFCSGLMLFEPKAKTVDELVASQGKVCWGDQVVIARTFSGKNFATKEATGREWKVWDNEIITFRGCQHKFKPKVIHHADLPGNDPGPAWK